VDVHGAQVTLRSSDGDETIRALITAGVGFRDLEVAGADLEEAFLALTKEAS
jgi:ABC-2 type transport system ATP-binding protein